ncbi:GNAT family N-acetyltransferase [Candidatus Pacearchaeota archaeon]|nr:GNAT family N-acetyltransferase [Candidatus Pacearchaeota archaeon]
MKILEVNVNKIDDLVNIEMSSGYHENPSKSEITKLFLNFFNSSRPNAYVIYMNEKAIGYFAFRIIRNNCELDYIAVSKDYQGKGYGKKLIDKLLNLCKKLEIDKIKLSVRSSNNIAINLYKLYGFVIIRNEGNKTYMVKELK